MEEKILILDFGSQYTQLIARRVRELDTYCEIYPFSKGLDLINNNVIGIILSGSPCSVRDANSPDADLSKVRGKIPVLGICYGAQLMARQNGGEVRPSTTREYGRAKLVSNFSPDLLAGISDHSQVWMSHADTIVSVPKEFEIVASTETVKVAAFKIKGEQTYGIQFHPEVTHSLEGRQILKNFVVNICGSRQSWTARAFIQESVDGLKTKLGNDKVVMALSGGVDSTVAAMLVHKAIGKNLFCIFVDNGVLRLNEYEAVLENYLHMGLNIKGVNSKDKFYNALKGKSDPEEKRKAIGKTFIDVFDEESKILKEVNWLGQGTIYPDVIESVSVNGPSVTIKSHHNVGGLPEKMHLKVVEPLRSLFKDEVREVGKELGISPGILQRHPFPGPGLAIRILGEITPEKVEILQKVDDIFVSSLKESGLYDQVWQAGAILLPVQSVGVMGDERTYENAVALRAVTSVDGMTADWAHLPYEFLAKVSNDIINKVKGVNRVVYDISSKPPATIEWE